MMVSSFQYCAAQTADSLLNFIALNKSRASLFLQQNDTTVAALNENMLMPLASTVKVMVAIEFSKQAALHVLNEDKYVALSELNRYYLPNTDGNAHPNWIALRSQKLILKATAQS